MTKEECIICKGVGSVQVTDVEWDTCRHCKGMGKVPIYDILDINRDLQICKVMGLDIGLVTDGYHTFTELYDHRYALFMMFCYQEYNWYVGEGLGSMPWRSKLHSDGTSYEGWFILGLFKEPGRQVTCHLPLSKWEDCWFAEELEKAPGWDGHTAKDVTDRIYKIMRR